MNKHVKILGYLYIAFSSLALAGCFLVYAIYAGSMTTLGILNEDSTLIAITGAIGALFFLIVLIPTLPGILAGYGLLKNKPWARVLTIIMGILYLMAVPVGTALGIYTLWVLFNEESKSCFK